MSFLSKIFSRAPKAALPTLEALLEARGLAPDLPGLPGLGPDFEHLDSPEEREAWVDALKALHEAGAELPGPWTEVLDQLQAELVPIWQAEREGSFHRPVAEGVTRRFRVGLRVVRPADLVLWHVDREEVVERATDALREASQGSGFERLPSGIYRAVYADGQAAARLLLPELWCNLFPGQNTFVTVPRQDTLLVAPQVLLPKLVESTQQALRSPGGLRVAGTLLQWVNGQLTPANLQDPHPMAQAQREFRQMDLLEAYAAQAQDLPPSLGLPAPVGLLTTQQGRTYTMATWTAGAPVLLPEADLLAFLGPEQEPLGIYQRQTLPRIPELRGEPVEIWGPRRTRYVGFPSAEQLERLEVLVNAEQMRAMMPKRQSPTPAPAQPAAPPSRPPHLHGVSLGVQDGD